MGFGIARAAWEPEQVSACSMLTVGGTWWDMVGHTEAYACKPVNR